MKIDLNIFTNATRTAPNTDMIRRTFDSFCETFGYIAPVVWVDSHPNLAQYSKYAENLQKIFPNVRASKSLSDGYVKSINLSSADYLFQLENDWEFVKQNIKHTLDEITNMMCCEQIYHLRFNKRKNVAMMWDKTLEERESSHGIKYCVTPVLSNNPHLIDKHFYKKNMMGHIKIMPGSKGIEEQFFNTDYHGTIYGGYNYPQTCFHTDGRRG